MGSYYEQWKQQMNEDDRQILRHIESAGVCTDVSCPKCPLVGWCRTAEHGLPAYDFAERAREAGRLLLEIEIEEALTDEAE